VINDYQKKGDKYNGEKDSNNEEEEDIDNEEEEEADHYHEELHSDTDDDKEKVNIGKHDEKGEINDYEKQGDEYNGEKDSNNEEEDTASRQHDRAVMYIRRRNRARCGRPKRIRRSRWTAKGVDGPAQPLQAQNTACDFVDEFLNKTKKLHEIATHMEHEIAMGWALAEHTENATFHEQTAGNPDSANQTTTEYESAVAWEVQHQTVGNTEGVEHEGTNIDANERLYVDRMVCKLMDRVRDIEDGCEAYGIGNCMFALYSVGHDYELVKGGGTDTKYKIYGPHKCDWILRRAFRGWQMLQWLESDISSEDNSEQEHTDTSSEIEKTARFFFVEKTEKIHEIVCLMEHEIAMGWALAEHTDTTTQNHTVIHSR
jgi:hypothetical protein